MRPAGKKIIVDEAMSVIYSSDMLIHIKRIDTNLPLPQYHTRGAACFDLAAAADTVVPARGIARIPSGLIIATPPGYVLILSARSSLAAKKGLLLANGIGIIDSDYCGPDDEILISVYNITDREVVVERGERIAQGMFLKVERAEWEEMPAADGPNRGGFGSTGL
jgi:dUTP pyrophosphatase